MRWLAILLLGLAASGVWAQGFRRVERPELLRENYLLRFLRP